MSLAAQNAIEGAVRFRTLYIAAEEEAESVSGRIEAALRGEPGWLVGSVSARVPEGDGELALAQRLMASHL